MCTETFLHLPQEKRSRVLNAAWSEFTSVPFANVSINKIVRRAQIPRGSFYQYFESKNDLFTVLIEDVRGEMMETMRGLMDETRGDIFRSTVMAYDMFLEHWRDGSMPALNRCIQVLHVNPGIDLENVLTGRPADMVTEKIMEELDLSALRCQEKWFVERICCLTGMTLGGALMESLHHPEQAREIRGKMLDCLDIIRRGSVRQETLREGGFSQ